MRQLSLTLLLLPLVLGMLVVVQAQRPNLAPDTPGEKPVPVVTFDMVFAGATPAHYSIAVDSAGRAAYRSDEMAPQPDRELSTGEPYLLKFTISEATRTRIFQLAERANYFHGKFNYEKGRIADTGTKTLTYSKGPADPFGKPTTGVRYQTVYNYSANPAIQQLTTTFQAIASTIELGHRVTYLRRFDKLGLDAELKRAEEMARDGQLLELQAIAPALHDVAGDTSVMHIARERAERLLKQIDASAAATP